VRELADAACLPDGRIAVTGQAWGGTTIRGVPYNPPDPSWAVLLVGDDARVQSWTSWHGEGAVSHGVAIATLDADHVVTLGAFDAALDFGTAPLEAPGSALLELELPK
jgi:hypothetical protein